MNRHVTSLIGALCLGCGADRELGVRFQAERDLWRVSSREDQLSLHPRLAAEKDWKTLAADYEALADRYLVPTAKSPESFVRRQIEYVCARALFRAAETHERLHDLRRVEEIYEHMAGSFDHVPELAARVALERGAGAERDERFTDAIRYYRLAINRSDPRSDDQSMAERVLELPLHVARLYSRAEPDDREGHTRHYQAASDYYQKYASNGDGRLVVDSTLLLAAVARDGGDWWHAAALLDTLDSRLRGIQDPPRDPAEVRVLLAEAKHRSGADLETTRAILLSVVKEFPASPFAPAAAFALVDNALFAGDTEEALRRLDDVTDTFGDDVRVASAALLRRGEILESDGRWSDALAQYRLVGVEYPATDAALEVPLRIARHHERVGDEEARFAALVRAEKEYRGFIERYPTNNLTVVARERLIEVLAELHENDRAVTEMERYGEIALGTARGAKALERAARIAVTTLADTTRAIAILDRLDGLYPSTPIGDWAAKEAGVLRGGVRQ